VVLVTLCVTHGFGLTTTVAVLGTQTILALTGALLALSVTAPPDGRHRRLSAAAGRWRASTWVPAARRDRARLARGSFTAVVLSLVVAQENVRSVVATIGLIAAVPVTTALAAWALRDREPVPR
jgi:uncharacterized membrane protein